MNERIDSQNTSTPPGSLEGVVALLRQELEWLPEDPVPCREIGGNVFFAGINDDTESIAQAIRICGGCPVRRQCLDYALNEREEHGVWGGTTPTERRRMRKERKGHTKAD